MMVPYFPFPPVFDMKMGTAPLDPENPLVEVDHHYREEIQLKKSLLSEKHAYYFQSQPGSMPAQWEVVEKILSALHRAYPEKFELAVEGSHYHWKNNLLNEEHKFISGDASTLPYEPLDWVGRQVQEDLLLLNAESTVVAGQLCFPSGWCLDEKIGQHFVKVHAPLPSRMNPMVQAAEKLIERIPPHRPIGRTNWGFRVCNQLDLSSRHRESYLQLLNQVSASLEAHEVGEKIFFRIERQTLSRLPLSGHVLFTIHTYNSLMKEEVTDKHRAAAMLSFLKTVPDDLLAYKLITPYAEKLIGYLEGNQ